MSKKKDAAGKGGKTKFPKSIAGIKIPKAVRQSGTAAIELAQSPEGRKVLSASLAAAAAAISANNRTRSAAMGAASEAGKATSDAAHAASDSAARIAAALIGIAGVAAERFFGGGDGAAKSARTDQADAQPEAAQARKPAKADAEFPIPPNGRG